ncbi:MAG TPA: type II secretion system F family protein [Gaiellales bacterium]|nr:type II secretion system F family protein [Gaiellales bacterium]
MKRFVILALTVAVAGLAASAAPAAAGVTSVRLALSPDASFPQRQFTLVLPPKVKPYNIRLTENGIPVIAHLSPIVQRRVPLSVAVLLDTSNSMRGPALSAAVDAAETLIADKPARAEAAVFGFAERPYLIHGWASSPSTFDASLAAIEPSQGTAIWDAVGLASQSVGDRDGAARALVLLTDGSDTTSAATVDEAAQAARSAQARVYVVGLPGAETNEAGLRRLVAETGGELIQVRSLSQLRRVYAGVAAELAQQYVLTYTSQLRGTGRPVTVKLNVDGQAAEVHYRIPPTSAAPAPSSTGWWTTQQALQAISAGVGLIVLLSAYLLMRPKRTSPIRRMRGYMLGGAAEGAPDVAALLPPRPRRSLPRPGPGNVWGRFAADVDRGDLKAHPVAVLLLGIAAGTAAAAVAGFAAGQPLAIAAGPIVGAVGVWVYVTHRASAWYAHFDASLPDALAVLASSLRAGHSLLQAVDHVADEADEMTAREWGEVVRQTRLGIPVEDALDEMTHRVANTDLQWISLVARVQRQIGGNMAEMFDIVATTVRDRHRLRTQVRTLTAQGRMTRWILTLAPVVLAGLMMLVSPLYISGFLNSTTGRALLGIAAVLIVIGSIWLKKIVEIEV